MATFYTTLWYHQSPIVKTCSTFIYKDPIKIIAKWCSFNAWFSVHIFNIPVIMDSFIAIKTYSGRTEAFVAVEYVPYWGHRHAQVAHKIRSHLGGIDFLMPLIDSLGLPTTTQRDVVSSAGITCKPHYNDVITGAMASQITGVSIVYSTVCSGADQRRHRSSASLAFVRGIHRWLVNSPHKGPVGWKMFPCDDVSMIIA